MGCRFPDADDPAALLDVVLTGRRAFRRLPPGRIDLLDYYSADPATPDATYSTRAAVLEGWRFDWRAFDIPEPVFRVADPAQWLALETAARALAAAGFPGGSGLATQRTGVIIGNTLTGDSSRAAALRLRWPYVRRVLTEAMARTDIPRDRAAQVLRHAAARYLAPFPGITDQTLADAAPATIAARICSYFGFRGGSFALDGSSASSLLAVAAACTALTVGDLDVALAGGVDLSLDPIELIGLAKTGLLASGDVRVYDENPTGFLPGEGCGVLVLMRAADARNNGVPVYAEIAGWGVSSAGQAGPAEADRASHLLALKRAYQRAQIDPADVQLIEGHGTGTQAGDDAELTALAELRAGTRQLAALGSIKANIGHTRAAAGSASLIKTVLALSTGLIPPTTGQRTAHQLLRGGDTGLWLPSAPAAWPEGVRLAGVSAMGTGGGNAHIVLRGQPDRGRHKARAGSQGWPRGAAGPARSDGAAGARAGTGTGAGFGTVAGSPAVAGAELGADAETRIMAGTNGGAGTNGEVGVGGHDWRPGSGQPGIAAYLLHAPDRAALMQILGRVAQVAPWLADSEMCDLASQLARDAHAQGPVRMAIVASRQEQLARLARDGMTILPRLADGLLAVRPGIYAADGGDGRVTLLLPGRLDAPARPQAGLKQARPLVSRPDRGADSPAEGHGDPAGTVRLSLAVLSWLQLLGVHGTAAVGHGLGELVGLAWAGSVTEADAIRLASQLAEILATAQAQHSGPAERAARLRTAAAKLKLMPPRRRLIAASTGRELTAILDVTEVLCAQLDSPEELDQALRAGAVGASLFLETGPGRALAEAASAGSRVPAVSLDAGSGTTKDVARATAALFAVGALGNPQVLCAGRPARPINIWRDQVFITNPCQALPRRPAAQAPPARPGAPAGSTPASGTPASGTPASGTPMNGSAPGSRSRQPGSSPRPPQPGLGHTPAQPGPGHQSGSRLLPQQPAPGLRPQQPGAGNWPPENQSGPYQSRPGSGLHSSGPRPGPHQPGPAPLMPPGPGAPAAGARPVRARTPGAQPFTPQPPGARPLGAQLPGLPELEPYLSSVSLGGRFRAGPRGEADQAPDPIPGVAPWVRCFAEQLSPLDWPLTATGVDQRWRIRASTRDALTPLISELFHGDPAAGRVLAIVPDPTDSASCVTALLAAQDAIDVGQLVVITHGPGFTGFFASLHAEHPGLGITVLRVPDSAGGIRSAERFAVAEPGRFRELVIDVAGQPYEPCMVPVPATGHGTFPLGPADVVLVNRAAGGAGLALAQVLACCGAAIAVIGREDPAGDSEVIAGLEQLRSAGARVTSEIVDMAAAADVAAAVQRIERKLGLVTAIVHAAEPGALRPLAGLTETGLRANVAAQTAGLNQLLGAVRRDRVALIVTFGSIASRYGLARAGLLALASGSLACQAERASEIIPGCRALHVDWPSWTHPAQSRRPGLANRMTRAGVQPIPVNEGSRVLLKMLTTAGFPASAAVHSRIGSLGQAQAIQPRPGRFIQAVRMHYPGVELVCEAQICARADPYLADYQIDGMSVLPAAMALEAMAQAASVLAGGPVRSAIGVSADSPVVIPAGGRDASVVIRICALRDGDTVTVVLRCADSSFAVNHLRAVFNCGPEAAGEDRAGVAALPELDEMAATDAGIVDGTQLYGPICFQSGRFRRAALLPEVTSRSCRAIVRGGDDLPWFGGLDDEPDAQLALGSPGLADATWHVLQACVPHRRLQLAGCDSVRFSGLTADGAVEVRAVRTQQSAGPADRGGAAAGTPARAVIPRQGRGPEASAPPAYPGEYVWDVEAADSSGRPVITWNGLRLRDTGPLPHGDPWPSALLAVYLEQVATGLGLSPELRIAVQQRPPAGDDPRFAQNLVRPKRAGAVVPKPSLAAHDSFAPAGQKNGSSAVCVAPGAGALAGFELTARAPALVACSWTVAEEAGQAANGPGANGPGADRPALTRIQDDMRDRLGEPAAALSARLTAVAGCLAAARMPAAEITVADAPAEDGWVLLRASGAAIACTVVQLAGVGGPVAVAIMTGPAELDERPPAAARQAAGSAGRPTAATGRSPAVGRSPAASRSASTSRSASAAGSKPSPARKPRGKAAKEGR